MRTSLKLGIPKFVFHRLIAATSLALMVGPALAAQPHLPTGNGVSVDLPVRAGDAIARLQAPDGSISEQRGRVNQIVLAPTVDPATGAYADGLYKYEIDVIPPGGLKRRTPDAFERNQRAKSPHQSQTFSGHFRVINGSIVYDNASEQE